MKKIWGMICGNNMCIRGYYDGQKGAEGEKWYIDINGMGWSQWDVTFKPDDEDSA